MKPFSTHIGVALHLPWDNVDTDQIIPARYLHRARAEGFGEQLFHDLRYDDSGRLRAGFPLNQSVNQGATVLIAGRNFGCGSSREQAVWALVDHGFRVVIAPDFGDIFFGNSLKNGLLVIALPESRIAALMQALPPDRKLGVDLAAQTITVGDALAIGFDIDPYGKDALLRGASEIAMTLQELPAIERFEAAYQALRPWIIPSQSDRHRP